MAQTATIYNLVIDLADIDRGVYEKIEVRVARQPSETIEYLLMRVLAYCLEFEDGIMLTEGVAAGDEPAVLIRDLTGKITAWIEVGMPGADRLHRGRKAAARAAVYTHRDVRKLLAEFATANIYKANEIPVYAFDRSFVEKLGSVLERRSQFSISVTERELYVEIAGSHLTTTIEQHQIK
jgi:uncharacterized protein YaeQ